MTTATPALFALQFHPAEPHPWRIVRNDVTVIAFSDREHAARTLEAMEGDQITRDAIASMGTQGLFTRSYALAQEHRQGDHQLIEYSEM